MKNHKTKKHPIHGFVWGMFKYHARAMQEPTTGYWLAFAGPQDKQGIILKYDVDAIYKNGKEALDALVSVIKKDLHESIGPNENPRTAEGRN